MTRPTGAAVVLLGDQDTANQIEALTQVAAHHGASVAEVFSFPPCDAARADDLSEVEPVSRANTTDADRSCAVQGAEPLLGNVRAVDPVTSLFAQCLSPHRAAFDGERIGGPFFVEQPHRHRHGPCRAGEVHVRQRQLAMQRIGEERGEAQDALIVDVATEAEAGGVLQELGGIERQRQFDAGGRRVGHEGETL